MASSAVARAGLALALSSLLGPAFGAARASAAPARPASAQSAQAGAADPADRSLAERRAVRGSPVDDVAATETPELREIRRFEEQAFPKPGGPETTTPGRSNDGTAAPSALPGEWGGSGDVPAEVRSPQSAARVDGTAPPPDSEWLRGLKLPDLPVRWDAQVLRYLDYFKSDPKGHAVMAGWLRRAGRYRELFEKTLERQGLPKDLFYVAMVESGFDTGARSRVGAGGIWQFMPGAARAYGLEVSYWVDARRDPERAVDAAARYLKDLYVRFGSWYLVFAAYNAGYGSVLRSITTYNTNDFWELCRHESGLPWESTLYVPKILAAAIVGHNLAAFGFADVTLDAPFAYEQVDVPAGHGAGDGGARGGHQGRGDRGAEPGPVPRRARRPIAAATKVRLPPGTASVYAASFDKTRDSDKLETVVLRFGETLDDVARAHGSSVRELRRLNGVKETAELRGGTSIVVPRRATAGEGEGQGERQGRRLDGRQPTAERRRRRRHHLGGRARSLVRLRRARAGLLPDPRRRRPRRGRRRVRRAERRSGRVEQPRSRRQASPADGPADLRAQGLRSGGRAAARSDEGAGGDPRVGGVPAAGDRAARKEAPALQRQGGRHAGQARAALRAHAGRSRAHQPLLVQHRAARR